MEIFFHVLGVWVLCDKAASIVEQNQREDFSKAAERLVRSLKLPEERLQQVPGVLADIERALGTHWPGCRAAGFGSTVTGLMTAQSDVDTLIRLNRTNIEADVSSGAIVEEAKTVLEQNTSLFTDLHTTANKLFSVVICRHIPSGFSVDISFGDEFSPRNSQLLRYLLQIDNRVLDLAIILKHWAQLHKITGGKRFPSTGITMLLVTYLQQLEMLPPVALLQKNAEPYIVDVWNTGFKEIDYSPRSNLSLYELLGGFFEYYDNFDFEQNIVSPFVGYPIKRQLFENLQNVPQEFDLYKRNVELNLTQPLRCGHICVQEPFDHSWNYGANCDILKSGRNSTFMIQLRRAAHKYREGKGSEFLDQILTVEM